jgi:hypothetical protein
MRFPHYCYFAIMSTRTAYISSLTLGLLSWGALAALVNYTKPDALPQLAAGLALLMVAISATTMPIWGRIHQRLTSKPQDPILKIAVRQGLWAGLFVAILLTFHFVGLLDWILVLVTLMLFVLLEAFLQQRDRWKNTDQKTTSPPPKASKRHRSSPASSHRASYSMARTKKSSAKKGGKKKK